MPRPVEAITFDLWDTIVIDDSDEPKRAAQHLRPKSEARPFCIYEALSRHTDLSFDTVRLAYNTANAAFNVAWKDLHVTWTVPQRLDIIFKGLGVTLPKDDLAALVETLENMEVVIRPDPIPGVHDTLKSLSQKYPLAIISDAIFSPGRALRQLLEGEGLLGCFSATVFSDETGFSKPDPRVFQSAAEQLNVKLENIVHIGDRDHNDVKGPQSLGARAVLFTASRDKDKENTTADAICERYEDLEAIIAKLDER
jgi:putative hydrolase of the HAD superfamily